MIRVLVFTAKWCKHCGGIDKALESITNVEKYDADENTVTCGKFNVASLPTVIILKDNQEVKRFVGETLVTVIEKYLNTLKND